MKESYLEVTFRHGRAFAAYLYLPRNTEDKSYYTYTSRAEPDMIIDFDKS